MSQTSLDQAPLILASASPRRHELLKRYAIPFQIGRSEFDEECFKQKYSTLSAEEYVEALARAKGRAYRPNDSSTRWVLSADTIIDFNGEIIGKAKSLAEARCHLESFCGTSHRVLTALALCEYRDSQFFSIDSYVESARIHFYPLDDYSRSLIDIYLASAQYQDKAGSYGIQELSGLLIKAIEGDYHCIMGLPLHSLFRRWPFLLDENQAFQTDDD
ncbi:MAG: Maf family protein [Eubacteriales bacterium]|nr:Maf family protein [Eubacteriales bacterium]